MRRAPVCQFASPGSDWSRLAVYLRALEVFIPRVKPFRPPPKSTEGLPSSIPTLPNVASNPAFIPFATLKRDLVQLIGILVNDHQESQDRTRAVGGVELILSMCVTDEANPCEHQSSTGSACSLADQFLRRFSDIREHALFAVRNLMIGNQDNQARIAEMEPLGIVDENGELRELPERLGAKRNTGNDR